MRAVVSQGFFPSALGQKNSNSKSLGSSKLVFKELIGCATRLPKGGFTTSKRSPEQPGLLQIQMVMLVLVESSSVASARGTAVVSSAESESKSRVKIPANILVNMMAVCSVSESFVGVSTLFFSLLWLSLSEYGCWQSNFEGASPS